MTSRQRARLIMEICTHEMQMVSRNDKDVIETCIRVQIDEAINDKLLELNRNPPPPVPLTDDQRKNLNLFPKGSKTRQ